MKIDLQKLLPVLNLVHSASKDVTRFHLNGVQFDPKLGRGRATDGHCLAEVTLSEWEAIDEKPVIIPREACLDALKVKHGFGEAEIADGKITLTHARKIETFSLIDGQFPDCDSVFPRGEIVASVGINADLLAQVQKALRENKRQGVRISFYANGSPLLVEMDGGKRGLVMPMRL